MENKILGIHHITAIAGNAKRNYDFYTNVLGLRMVKKTVNFDDPGTYHFYFGDEVGTPGTILTFFPWEGIQKGRNGNGMATDIGYSVPDKSFDFWAKRFKDNNVKVTATGTRFGEQFISFEDPDGLALTLVVPKNADARKPWETDDVKAAVATKGFHSITLTLRDAKETAKILTDIFGYRLEGKEENRYRYVTDAVPAAAIIDIVETPNGPASVNAGGTIHHIAFRVKDEETLMAYREKVVEKGLRITEKIDRNYFFSLYFREPGGVLFEIATDNPGFSVDEPVSELGKNLKLPSQYESHRKQIEEHLPVIN
ncbi:ring-cleaving dioxygenase [Chryseolinea lacunae]|uniref:Ring-cleaving dioxygenase n=1 Tax=Chryseolinea lacunae TaxID=2801331 RepID=A0ABS1L1N3_9BACT|nr:ring-cleaving dioxygenase [Chryseolinea lacunae]MBL0745623.1 ring-cleaving dioxygenase [Chryseolinea lacunae]